MKPSVRATSTSILSKKSPGSQRISRSAARKDYLLPSVEWDFKGVPEDETQACLYYEYGRECLPVMAALTVWRRYFPFGTPWPTAEENWLWTARFPKDAKALDRFHTSPARIAAGIESFPNTAWLEIASTKRRHSMNLVRWGEAREQLASLKKQRNHPALSKLTFNSFFEIRDWSWTDEELVSQFGRWLSERRAEPADTTKPGRQEAPSDLLRHLGALRLCRHAKRCRGSSRNVDETDRDTRNLLRSAKKAAIFLNHFYK